MASLPPPLHLHYAPIEAPQGEALEQLVAGALHFGEDPDRDLFAEEQTGGGVAPPMDAGKAAAQRNVGGELVELSANRQLMPFVGQEHGAVGRGFDRREEGSVVEMSVRENLVVVRLGGAGGVSAADLSAAQALSESGWAPTAGALAA